MDHRPVLLDEALELLAVKRGGSYVDGTLGLGGHAAEILRRSAPDGRLLGTDRDGETLSRARETLAEFGERVRVVQADFRAVPALLAGHSPDGILLDLGMSSAQLDDPERGLSFQAEGPLDMRLDRSSGPTAAEVVNRMRERELADVIYRYGEETASRRIARAIVEARPLRTTRELAEVVKRAAPRSRRPGLHPATRTFQALRIHVNRELEALGEALRALALALRPGGRMAVIAFHSLEDREVKLAFRGLVPEGFRVLTKKPVRPGERETGENPRARSARLRAIEREEAA
ncbi:MAG TPA: 16S rRNA (cytosine(1402)-N(4))-methyltransferase RsmH [Vicinamibacteria bacterium]